MELLGIIVFVLGLASSFYKDHQEKKKAEARKVARRFEAANEPSKMSENGVNQQRNKRQTQNQRPANRNKKQEDKPKTLADYLAKAQNYLDEVDAEGQKSFEELKAERLKEKKQSQTSQRRNAGQQNRGQEFAKQNQEMRAQKQRASLNQPNQNSSQKAHAAGERDDWDKATQMSSDSGYNPQGSLSSEMSNDDNLNQEMSANDLALGQELKQMDAMYDKQADQLDKELNSLFKGMADAREELRVTTETKKKSRNARDLLALDSQDDLKRGILLKEILDKPVSKRHQA